jgi:PAT family beta-lactamase induction signal transducer AmpG
MGEAMLGFVSLPFYMELGYSKGQIAVVVKGFGVIATILGTYAGGMIICKRGNIKGLIICGIAQSLSNLMYIWLHYQEVSNSSLLITVSIDNFTGGMGCTALIGYLSALCNKQYTATQYALLSSMASLMNNSLSGASGSIIQWIGWDMFFTLTVILEIPSLLLLSYIGRQKSFPRA